MENKLTQYNNKDMRNNFNMESYDKILKTVNEGKHLNVCDALIGDFFRDNYNFERVSIVDKYYFASTIYGSGDIGELRDVKMQGYNKEKRLEQIIVGCAAIEMALSGKDYSKLDENEIVQDLAKYSKIITNEFVGSIYDSGYNIVRIEKLQVMSDEVLYYAERNMLSVYNSKIAAINSNDVIEKWNNEKEVQQEARERDEVVENTDKNVQQKAKERDEVVENTDQNVQQEVSKRDEVVENTDQNVQQEARERDEVVENTDKNVQQEAKERDEVVENTDQNVQQEAKERDEVVEKTDKNVQQEVSERDEVVEKTDKNVQQEVKDNGDIENNIEVESIEKTIEPNEVKEVDKDENNQSKSVEECIVDEIIKTGKFKGNEEILLEIAVELERKRLNGEELGTSVSEAFFNEVLKIDEKLAEDILDVTLSIDENKVDSNKENGQRYSFSEDKYRKIESLGLSDEMMKKLDIQHNEEDKTFSIKIPENNEDKIEFMNIISKAMNRDDNNVNQDENMKNNDQSKKISPVMVGYLLNNHNR